MEKAASKAEAAHEVAGLSYDVFELAAVRRRVKDEDTLGDVHHTTAQRAVCFARSERREEGHAGHDRETKAAKHRWRYVLLGEKRHGGKRQTRCWWQWRSRYSTTRRVVQ